MAVVNVKEMRTEHEEERARDGKSLTIVRNRAFTVLCSDPVNDDEATALAATGIPRTGDAHPDDPYVPCISVVADRLEGAACLFLVRTRYQLRWPTTAEGFPAPADPTARPYNYQGGSVRSSETVTFDADGNWLANNVGEPYDPPLTEEIYDPRIVITRVEADLPFAHQASYVNTVNGDSFMIAGRTVLPGEARMYDINYSDFVSPNVYGILTRYWEVTYEIHFRFQRPTGTDPDKAWYRRIAHEGFYLWHDAQDHDLKKRVRITADGKETADPTPITLDGLNVINYNEGETEYKFHRRFVVVNWTPLGLFP